METIIEEIKTGSPRLANALSSINEQINDKRKLPTIYKTTLIELASVANMSILADALKVLEGKMLDEGSRKTLACMRNFSDELLKRYIHRDVRKNAPLDKILREDYKTNIEKEIKSSIQEMSDDVAERKKFTIAQATEKGSTPTRRDSEPAVSVTKQGLFKPPEKSTSAPPVLIIDEKVVDSNTIHQKGGKYDLNKGPRK